MGAATSAKNDGHDDKIAAQKAELAGMEAKIAASEQAIIEQDQKREEAARNAREKIEQLEKVCRDLDSILTGAFRRKLKRSKPRPPS